VSDDRAGGRTGVLVMAYGTPRQTDEIEPYYTDIRRGRPPTPELLADLVRRYEAIGGLSPLFQRTEAQRAAIARALELAAPGRYTVGLGLKHAAPSIEEGLRALVDGGADRIVGLVLAPHHSALSVGQYLERAEAAGAAAGVPVTGIRSWHLEPAYLDFLAAAVDHQRKGLPTSTTVLFTAHSLPERILATGDPYPEQLRQTAAAVADRAGLAAGTWDVAWQSAGRTPEPWLGPDVLAVIDATADRGDIDGVLVCACGFVADHLEVLYDLDIEARGRAAGRGLAFARTACVNDDPEVMSALARLVVDQVAATR
jgi:ferrochelatase